MSIAPAWSLLARHSWLPPALAHSHPVSIMCLMSSKLMVLLLYICRALAEQSRKHQAELAKYKEDLAAKETELASLPQELAPEVSVWV